MELERRARSATLDSLSNELILLILSNFCLHCREGPKQTPQAYFPATEQQPDKPSWYASDVAALHSMSLVSRRLSPLAQEILYHEFIPGYGDSFPSAGYDSFWVILPFLRTVAANPDRAASVKRVHVNLNLLYSVSNVPALAEEVLTGAAQARGIDLSDFLAPFRDPRYPFNPDQYQPACDEVLGMLLACLPNLKTLSLTAGVPSEGITASALRAAGVSALPIETLDLTCCVSKLRCRLDGILELASTTIRNLYLYICDGDGLGRLARHGPFPNLRSLCITDSRLSGSDLASFLSHCSSLETFSYESTRPDDDLLFSDAAAHLIRNKDTLRTLHLNIPLPQEPPRENLNTRRVPELLASLHTFPVLRNLLVSSEMLLLYTCGEPLDDLDVLTRLLPPSLVSLQVTLALPGDSRAFRIFALGLRSRALLHLGRWFAHLAQAVAEGRFPSLKSISCHTRDRLDGWGLDARFASAGVAFGYDGWAFHDGVPGRRLGSRADSPVRSITPVSSDGE